MKICLINPPHPYLVNPAAQAPAGLLYVAAALEQKNIDIVVKDFSELKYNSSFDIPMGDLYGITGTVLDRVGVEAVAESIKQKYQNAKIVLGGPLSIDHKFINTKLIDSIVFGEGEEIIFDIIKDFPNIRKTYRAKRIQNIDNIPFPARHLIKNQGGNIFAFGKNYFESGSTTIITARGCPFNCAFCAAPLLWGRKVTYRSIENVVKEIDEVIKVYGIHQFRFSDDTLNLNVGRLGSLCDKLKRRNMVWKSSLRTKPNDLKMYEKMYLSGCREVSFGIESGDQAVLDMLKKGNTVQDNRQAIINARNAGIFVRILFMIGTPGESKDTVDKNIEFLESVKYDAISLTNFTPLSGSEIGKNPRKFGCTVINTDIDKYNRCMWSPTGKNVLKSLISVDGISYEDLNNNIERMHSYLTNLKKINKGE